MKTSRKNLFDASRASSFPVIAETRVSRVPRPAQRRTFSIRVRRAAELHTRATCAPRTAGCAGERAAFTLIEMIGVMAIMAILAAVIVPTTLKSIEGAAVRAEVDTLGSLGVQMKLYAKEKGAMPTAAGWTTEIAPYAALNPTDILTNRRRINRLYVVDPTAINQRAMIISSMRSGVPLPSYAQVSGNFTNVWNTSYTDVPTGSGWGSWNANNKEYLAIERVNFRSELQSFSISLKNASAGTVSYQIFYSSGTPLTVRQPLAASATIVPVLRAGDRINLYRDSAGALLDYVVVVSTRGGTFQFNGTTWSAP